MFQNLLQLVIGLSSTEMKLLNHPVLALSTVVPCQSDRLHQLKVLAIQTRLIMLNCLACWVRISILKCKANQFQLHRKLTTKSQSMLLMAMLKPKHHRLHLCIQVCNRKKSIFLRTTICSVVHIHSHSLSLWVVNCYYYHSFALEIKWTDV